MQIGSTDRSLHCLGIWVVDIVQHDPRVLVLLLCLVCVSVIAVRPWNILQSLLDFIL